MPPEKKEHPKEKAELHARNRHRVRYDFPALIKSEPALKPFVRLNEFKDASLDFFNPEAVKTLNRALLKHFYGIQYWDIPAGYLCPPIPGRADYIHHIADVLAQYHTGGSNPKVPKGAQIKCLDIGVGANCVYPIIGAKEYGWSFVGADIDPVSVASAQNIVERNAGLKDKIDIRRQPNPRHIFAGIIQENERFDLTICNPPFHASAAEANAGSTRKLRNLKGKKVAKPLLNFGGQSNELWCEGGEATFLANMIRESRNFSTSCFMFSALVSKSAHLPQLYRQLERVGATQTKTIPMSQGNKASRILTWTFFSPEEQKLWVRER